MTARKSYQDHLAEGTTAEPLECAHCNKITPVWGLYLGEGQEPTGWICGGCIASTARDVVAAAIAAARIPDIDWRSDKGIALKAERNRLLDYWRWTIMPDSPLSLTCQVAFKAYLDKLQRMTLDFDKPTLWTWPVVPALAYPGTISATTGTK